MLTWEAPKDPDEVKDYGVNWLSALSENDDTVASSTWTIVSGSGLTINSDSFADTATTVWFSAGIDGVTYELLNRVVTAGGRTLDQSVRLRVRSK